MGAGPKVKCLTCGDVIQSKHRHDFVWCSCRDNYEGVVERFLADYDSLIPADVREISLEDLRENLMRRSPQIAVDGGEDYLKMVAGKEAKWEMWKE